MNDRFETKSPNAMGVGSHVPAAVCIGTIKSAIFFTKMVHKNHCSKQATDGTNGIPIFCEALQIQGSYLVITNIISVLCC